jgi:hypothetical protein
VPTGEHDPRPGLDDLAERSQVPGSTAPYPTPGPVPARTGRGRRQPAPRAPTPAAPAAPGRSPLRPRSPPPPRRPTGPPPRSVAEPSAPGARVVGRLVDLYPSRLGRRLGTAASTHGTLPHHRAMPHQGALLSSDDFGSRVDGAAKLHPLCRAQ